MSAAPGTRYDLPNRAFAGNLALALGAPARHGEQAVRLAEEMGLLEYEVASPGGRPTAAYLTHKVMDPEAVWEFGTRLRVLLADAELSRPGR